LNYRARNLLLACVAVVCAFPIAAQSAKPQPGQELLIFGASSLTNVLDEIGAAYQRETRRTARFSYAASSALARQIEASGKADVFVSADTEWMDYLQTRDLINRSTRKDLLGNRLVIVAPAGSTVQLRIAPDFPLAAALGKGRLATGDPDSVPVGRYARSALTNLGVWNDVADRLIRAENVRSALGFLARGEAPLGIVYETDALVEKHVRIVDVFPANTHTPIVYPVAATRDARPGATAFVKFLSEPTAVALFRKYGFTVLQ